MGAAEKLGYRSTTSLQLVPGYLNEEQRDRLIQENPRIIQFIEVEAGRVYAVIERPDVSVNYGERVRTTVSHAVSQGMSAASGMARHAGGWAGKKAADTLAVGRTALRTFPGAARALADYSYGAVQEAVLRHRTMALSVLAATGLALGGVGLRSAWESGKEIDRVRLEINRTGYGTMDYVGRLEKAEDIIQSSNLSPDTKAALQDEYLEANLKNAQRNDR